MKHISAIVLSLLALAGGRVSAVTLDAVLAQTLRSNPRILEAKAGLGIAAGQQIFLRAAAYPKAGVGSVAGDQGGQRSRSSGNQPFIFAYGIFSQPLFQAGIPAGFRRGKVAILVAQQQLNVAVAEELHKARLAFYRALYNRALESLGRAQRARLEANVASEQSLYEAGQSERGALTAATLLARELNPTIESAHTAYGNAVLQLAQSLGGSLGAGAVLPAPEGELTFEDVNLRAQDEVPQALKNRPDLKLARLLVDASREDQRLIAAEYYPTIDAVVAGDAIPVTGIYRDTGGSSQVTDNTLANEVGAGVAYTWRVVDNGKVGGAIAQERAVRASNELQLQRLEANVPRELARIENSLRAISARYRSLVGAIDLAESTVKSVQQNRAQGLASALDFRTAESDLLATRQGLLSAIYQQKVALAEWDRATGHYFQFSEQPGAKVP